MKNYNLEDINIRMVEMEVTEEMVKSPTLILMDGEKEVCTIHIFYDRVEKQLLILNKPNLEIVQVSNL